MAVKQFVTDWTKRDTLKSSMLFLLHFVIMIAIAAVLLLGNKMSNIGEYMKQKGAGYLYALFCLFLLVLIRSLMLVTLVERKITL